MFRQLPRRHEVVAALSVATALAFFAMWAASIFVEVAITDQGPDRRNVGLGFWAGRIVLHSQYGYPLHSQPGLHCTALSAPQTVAEVAGEFYFDEFSTTAPIRRGFVHFEFPIPALVGLAAAVAVAARHHFRISLGACLITLTVFSLVFAWYLRSPPPFSA
jgi:hypothetical protein